MKPIVAGGVNLGRHAMDFGDSVSKRDRNVALEHDHII